MRPTVDRSDYCHIQCPSHGYGQRLHQCIHIKPLITHAGYYACAGHRGTRTCQVQHIKASMCRAPSCQNCKAYQPSSFRASQACNPLQCCLVCKTCCCNGRVDSKTYSVIIMQVQDKTGESVLHVSPIECITPRFDNCNRSSIQRMYDRRLGMAGTRCPAGTLQPQTPKSSCRCARARACTAFQSRKSIAPLPSHSVTYGRKHSCLAANARKSGAASLMGLLAEQALLHAGPSCTVGEACRLPTFVESVVWMCWSP